MVGLLMMMVVDIGLKTDLKVEMKFFLTPTIRCNTCCLVQQVALPLTVDKLVAVLNTRDKFSKYSKIMDELQNIENQQGNGVLPCVSGRLSQQSEIVRQRLHLSFCKKLAVDGILKE